MKSSVRRLLCAVWLGASFASSAYADRTPLERCYETAATRLDVGPCLKARLTQAKEKLGSVVTGIEVEMNELVAVTGRDDAAKAFRTAQERFGEFRDANCAWHRAVAEPGTGAGDIELDCRIRVTERRAIALQRSRSGKRDPDQAME